MVVRAARFVRIDMPVTRNGIISAEIVLHASDVEWRAELSEKLCTKGNHDAISWRTGMIRKITAGLVALVSAFVFSTTLVHALLYAPDSEVVVTNPDSVPVSTHHSATPADYPVRLKIPSIGVDAAVQYVGITSHGTMSVPE